MIQKMLGVADLHLTIASADEYRWSIFEWMRELVEKEGITDILLCGDISDFKDEHGSEYVNKLVTSLSSLSKVVTIHWLMGNHDMIKEESPYFEFINEIEGLKYYKEPTFFDKERIAFLPYTKTPQLTWEPYDFSEIDLIFMHQPVIGAQSSDYYELQHGLDPKYFTNEHGEFEGQVFSGDIHIPQQVGDVTYFGAPYNIRFGDKVEGGGLIFESTGAGWEIEQVDFPCLKKWHAKIDNPSELEGYLDQVNRSSFKDQMKVTVAFSHDAYTNWKDWKSHIKKYCEEILKVAVGAITLDSKKADFESVDKASEVVKGLDTSNPLTVLEAYSEKEEIDEDLIKVGVGIINEVRA